MLLHRYNNFKEFKTEEEAISWATPIYKNWFSKDQCISLTGNKIADTFKMYCGNLSFCINSTLRGIPYFGESDEANRMHFEMANIIGHELSKFTIPDDIVTYRMVSGIFAEQLSKHTEIIIEKGFLSTGLVLNSLIEEHSLLSNAVFLKLYVPHGIHGAYIDFISRRPREQELLFPPTITLKVLHKGRFKRNRMWICLVENQELRFL